jgi:DNA mismatch repair ATPase MutS
MMQSPETIYKHRIEAFTSQLRKQKNRLGLISFLRLLSFIMVFVSLFFLTKASELAGILVSLMFLICFFVLVKRYHILARKNAHTSNLVKINSEEIAVLGHRYEQFDGGDEFVSQDHPFTPDLDVFGTGSIFQYLNRTTTLKGRQILADWLSFPCKDISLILKKQEAVKELTKMIDNRQNFQATGRLNSEMSSEMQDISDWMHEKNRYYGNLYYHMLCYILPAVTIILTIAAFFDFSFITFLAYLIIGQLLIVALHLRFNNKVHEKLGRKFELFKKYAELLKSIEEENYGSELIINLRHQLKPDGDTARENIKRLSSIISAFDNRLNLLTGIILNGLFLWDIQCVLKLEKWKTETIDKVWQWFDVLGEYDALCSLANYAFNNPDFVFPVPDSSIIFDFKQAGHPLIPGDIRVDNDIKISGQGEFVIITGANMAGKSTFLRTVSVNLLLGMMGAPICAQSARFSPVDIFSSMRTSDSLHKNESYFYAELKRLSELLGRLQKGNRLFIVLDEILKGTNSADKQKGSRAVLEKIIKLNGAGLIATHDLDLAELEKNYPDNLRNKCFEIEIDGDRIHFDYKLYDGITKKMNALLLMQQMGIITES